MSDDLERSAARIKAKVTSGLPINEAIVLLHQSGFSIVESMKFLKREYGISLAEAKKVVSMHPVWSKVVAESELLIDEILKVLQDERGKMR